MRRRRDRRAVKAEEDAVAPADLADPNPDVQELFAHYDALYFHGALAAAGFTVQWSSSLQSSSFGSCTFSKPTNTITLSEPVLKYRSCIDRKKALLHEMIHAIIYVKHRRKGCSQHGPVFRDWMDAINSSSIKDPQRPVGGYNITTRHDFNREEPRSFKGLLWKCESCGDTLARAINQCPPSDACCIENVDDDATCGNKLCHWHNHKDDCGGTYEKMGLQSVTPVQKKVPRGTQLHLTYPSEASELDGAVQESDSTALMKNTNVTRRNVEGRHLSLVNGSNAKSPGSSSLKKAGKRHKPEDGQKASVLPTSALKKLKLNQALAASEKDELFSQVCFNDKKSPGSSTSKMAGKWRNLEDVQKPSVSPSATQGKPSVLPAGLPRILKLNQALAASEKHDLFSPVGCYDKRSQRTSSLKMAGKRSKLEDVQKPSVTPAAIQGKLKQEIRELSVLPASPLRKLELNQALAVSEKHDLFSPVGCNDTKLLGSSTSKMAGKRHKPEDVQKSSVPPAAAQGKLKLKEDLVASEKNKLPPLLCSSKAKSPRSSSSKKARKQHSSESTQKACSLITPKQDLFAPEKNELFPPISCSNSKALDGSFSKKARRRHDAEDIQKATVLPAPPQRKLKQSSFVASKKRRSACKSKPAGKKEYAVMSTYLDYYESDRSSGSTEPLVNKRTERRKKERARILTYSRKKRINSALFDDSRINDSVSSHELEAEPRKDESMQQSRPPSPCPDIAVDTAADQVVVPQEAPGDQSQSSAPCLDIVPLQPADPPGLIPPDQSTGPDIIDISDDD